MSEMVPLEVALQRMMDAVEPLPPAVLPLLEVDGCVLAQDVVATRTKPPFDVSAMDGYALPGPPSPGERYQVVGEVPAGASFGGSLSEGQSVRIFTGARVPDDARHILIQEDAERDDDTITVLPSVGSSVNIRPAGGDFLRGDVLIAKGTVLTPQHIALAASGNHARLLVHRKPRVTIMMNGDELAWPGEDASEDAIIASNGFGLAALAQRYGAELDKLDLVADKLHDMQAFVGQCSGDILVTVGGASVGDYDLVRPALEAEGFALDFPKVALKPGKPTLFGRKPRDQMAAQTVLGLPGNPVSSMVSAMIFLRPLIEKLSGRQSLQTLDLKDGILGTDLPSNGPRAHFMRARSGETGALVPVTSQDSSLLRLLSNATALIYRPAHAPAADTGDMCQTIPLP